MSIKFFLKAEPDFQGKLRVLEHFEFATQEATTGKPFVSTDRVDEDVKKQYPKEYAEFAAYVHTHQESLYERARSGEVIFCPEAVLVAEPAKEEEKPKKGKAAKEPAKEEA
jgi:hypothetical protein